MPDQLAALDLDQQLAALKRAGLDTNKLQDPAELEKFVTRYLLKTGMDQAASQPDPMLALFQSSGSSDAASSSTGGLLNLLA